MAKRNIKKIISILAAVTIASSQLLFSAPMASAVAFNAPIYIDAGSLDLGKITTTGTDAYTKTVSLDSELGGSFIVTFDMTVNTLVADNTGFTMTIDSSGGRSGGKACGILRLGAYTEASDSYAVQWYQGNSSTSVDALGSIQVGKTYNYRMEFKNVGNGEGASVTFTITDAETGSVVSTNNSALSCRSYTNDNSAKNMNFNEIIFTLTAKDEETNPSVSFDSFKFLQPKDLTDINVTVDKATVGEEVENEDGEIEIQKSQERDIVLNAADNKTFYVGTSGTRYTLTHDAVGYNIIYGVKENITGIYVEDDQLVITAKAPEGATTFTLTAMVEGSEAEADMQININKEASTPEDLVNDVFDTLAISDADGKSVLQEGKTLTTTTNLVLPQGDDDVDIVWVCYAKNGSKWEETDAIDPVTGEYTVTKGFSGEAKLVATITSKADSSVSVEKTFYVNISHPDEQLELDLEDLQEYMEDYEEVKKDFELPKQGDYGSKITWTSSNPSVISTKGAVTRSSSDKKVTLTATLENGGKTLKEEFQITVEAKTTSSGSSGGSSSGSSRNTGGDSYTFYAPITTTLTNPVQQPDFNAEPNKTNQLQTLDKADSATPTFNDLAGVDWAVEAINKLAEKGIINGRSANQFAPQDNITRAEFAKILVSAFNLTDPNAKVSLFSDVKEGDWYYIPVASAFAKGIITGYDNGSFGVNDNISRQDMAVLLYRAAKAANYNLPILVEEVVYSDADQIDDYAKEAVTTLQRARIINGVSETEFAPKATATRAAAAKMVYGIYNLQ